MTANIHASVSEESGKLPSLFVIGDSISIQYGPYLETFLKGKFHYDRKRDHGGANSLINLDNPEGANGGDSKMVYDYLATRRVAGDPIREDVLLLNCGLHDIKWNTEAGKQQKSPEEYVMYLEKIVEETRLLGVEVLWVRSTPVVDAVHNEINKVFKRYNADLVSYNRIADEIMKRAGIESIDLYSFTEKMLPQGLVDHVHYNEETRRLQAAFIAGAVEVWWANGKGTSKH
ncbi:MAG: SGNH/GDSL hydrolase family protein [Chthoniobacterales bacterium]